MKKWIALLLALVMCLSLCACGRGKINDKSDIETSIESDLNSDSQENEVDSHSNEVDEEESRPAGTLTLSDFLGTGRHIFFYLHSDDEYIGKDGSMSDIFVVENGKVTKYENVYDIKEEDDSGYKFNSFGALSKMTDDEIIEKLESNCITPEEYLQTNAEVRKLEEKCVNGEITVDQLYEEREILWEKNRKPVKWPESPLEIAIFTDNSGNNTDYEEIYFLNGVIANVSSEQKLKSMSVMSLLNQTTPVYDSLYSQIEIHVGDSSSEKYWAYRNNEGITIIYDPANSTDLMVDPKQDAIESLFN